MKRIVYTRNSDSGVSVCCPTQWVMHGLAQGGMWGNLPRGALDAMIDRAIAGGRPADGARRFIRAMHFGGCSTAEAYAIVRDRDCAHLGTAFELWDETDFPHDRWFRDAWRRSPNGGPIGIDMKLARPVQWRKIRSAVASANKRREEAFEPAGGPIEPDWGRLRDKIRAAQDESDLRRIWVDDVPPGYSVAATP